MTKFHHQLRHTDAFLGQNEDSSVPWLQAKAGPKVLILTSRMAWNWYSLGLCHQSIEKSWLKLGLMNICVQYQHAESLKIEELIKAIFLQEIVVILQPSSVLFRALSFVRDNGWKGKCIFYSFADASLFGFPFTTSEALNILRSHDEVMVLCEADKKIFSDLLPGLSVKVVDIFPWNKAIELQLSSVSGLAYYGRISLFKNIHYLVLLLWKLNQEGHGLKLHLFGEIDSVSSQVLGMKDLDYKGFLQALIKRLKLGKQVIWHGSVDIGDVKKKYKDLLFLSPSTHRDENFGWAPREVINQGLPILLSDWGGYKDLIHRYPKSVHALPLMKHQDQIIPDFKAMLKKVKSLLKSKKKALKFKPPMRHDPLDYLASVHDGKKIHPSSLTESKLFPLWEQQASGNLVIQNLHLIDPDLTQEIFIKHYLGDSSQKFKVKTLFPWVELSEDRIVQRAPVERTLNRHGDRSYTVRDIHEQEHSLSEDELDFLIENGLLF